MRSKKNHRSLTFVSPSAYPLILGNYLGNTGGAERQFFLFGRSLVERGWRVAFVTSKPRGEADSRSAFFSIYYAHFTYLGGPKWHIIFDWLSLWHAMLKANTTYYVLKTPAHLLIPVSAFCKIYMRKLVFWAQTNIDSTRVRSGVNILASLMQNWGIKKANIILAQTAKQQVEFMANYERHAELVSSINDNLASNSSKEICSFTSDKKIDILWAGNSMPNKRQEVFFELARLLPHRKFAIAMNNSDLLRFEQAKREATKLQNVIFLGTVSPFKMENWFTKARLLLNTSVREGFPNTFLQAWTNGIPVVSLNVDPDGVISRYLLGYTIATEETIAYHLANFEEMALKLVPKIEELLEDDTIYRNISERTRRYIKENHTPDHVVPKLINALER